MRAITLPILRLARRMLPHLSATEREALAAGTLGWESELLRGDPGFQKLLAIPAPSLTPEEQAFLTGPAETLAQSIDDWHITHTLRAIPDPIWQILKQHRFFALTIPKQYGGLGFSAHAASAIVMKIAAISPSIAVTLIVPNSLGPSELLLLFGTEPQKQFWLPRLASGDEIPAFALTSETAGSDATSLTDHGTVTKENGVLGVRLNWSKRYISLSPVATVLGVAFRLNDPDHLLSETANPGLTLALVPTATEGVTTGRRHYPGLLAFPNGPTTGENVFVPIENIIGEAAGAGRGWTMLVTALAAGRGIMLPAMALAAVKTAAYSAGAYARIRTQFKTPIAEFEGIAEPLSAIAIEAAGLDAFRRFTLDGIENGQRPAVLSAMLKHAATEGARRAVNHAMDIHGGKAIMEGPRNYLGAAYRALPIAITVEGANILTRSFMIYGQGAMRCHPFLQAEAALAASPETAETIQAFTTLIKRHAIWLIRRWYLAQWHGWTRGIFARSPTHGKLSPHWRHLKRLSAALCVASELALLTQGGKLKRMEMLSGRFADMLTNLTITSALLRQPGPITHEAATHYLHAAERNLDELIRNFPKRYGSVILRTHLLPFGVRLKPPTDATRKHLARLLSTPGPTRDHLTEGITPHGPLRDLAEAFQHPQDPEKIARAIRVDDFAHGELEPFPNPSAQV